MALITNVNSLSPGVTGSRTDFFQGRELTQPYDKSPYTHRKFQNTK